MVDQLLRLATSSDLPAVTDLIRAAYGKYLARMTHPPAPMLLDYEPFLRSKSLWVFGTPVIGVIALRVDTDTMIIENVAVHPVAQGTGVGRRLMEFAETEAEHQSVETLTLYTNEVMTENVSLYQHLGYVEVDRREEDGYHRVFMEKRLPWKRWQHG